MNRLVIVGNGFDLANGLKSRYEDFIVDFVDTEIGEAFAKKERKENQLFTVEPNLSDFRRRSDYLNNFPELKTIEDIIQNSYVDPRRSAAPFIFTKRSPLFTQLLANKNWTDIEYTYFNTIKTFAGKNEEILRKINDDFEFLKLRLSIYLKKLQTTLSNSYNLEQLIKTATTPQTSNNIDYQDVNKERILKELDKNGDFSKTYVLNFNYTDAFNQYLSKKYLFNEHIEYISKIHGTVSDINSLIFGYGDEMAKEFKKFQEQNNDELIKHFKSFYYASSNEYHNLLGFLSQGALDVVVIGHSLGLSDRVLLNTIFENDNCKFIHLFHTGGDSHFRKRMALSRHFNNPAKFREKLLQENPKFLMPRG